LTLAAPEPAALLAKLPALAAAAGTFDGAAVVVSVATVAIIVVLKRLRPAWPGMLVAVVAAAAAVAAELTAHRVAPPLVRYDATIEQALKHLAQLRRAAAESEDGVPVV
jgi:MFS superfamily sulfate permease-like transporter